MASYSRQTQLRYRELGKCEQCGLKPPCKRSKHVCAACLKKRSAASNDKRRRHIGVGKCPQCGEQVDDETQRCTRCQELQNELGRERRAIRRRSGLCTSCGGVPARDRLQCERCLTRQAKRRAGQVKGEKVSE